MTRTEAALGTPWPGPAGSPGAEAPHPESRRWRVALVAPSLEILGGQGVQARALAEGLAREGHTVDFLPINPPFPPGLGWVRRHRYARTVVNEALYVPTLSRIRGSDVVHVFSASYWSFLLAAAPALSTARLLGKRALLHYHSGEAEDHLARWGAAVHPWLRMADPIVVPSEYLRGVFGRHGYAARVVPNVVDLSRFAYRERPRLRPRFLSTRNLEALYGVENTLRAFALLRARRRDATLTVAGYGSQEPSLRRLALALGGAECIRFVGRVEPAAMPRLLDAHDVFLNSSLVDNQPVSLLEAMASGLPVVTTGPGDIPAMVGRGEAGILVPAQDPEAMAREMAGLLEEPRRGLELARSARRQAEKHTWVGVRGAWAAAYAWGRP